MAIRFDSGRPSEQEAPTIVVALPIDPTVPVARLRRLVREAEEDGFGGVAVRAGDSAAITVIRDAARRAGLAALLPADQLAGEPHALAIDDPAVTSVDEPVAAFAALFAGAMVIAGPQEVAYALRDFLALTEDAAGWAPLAEPAGWRFRGNAREQAGFAVAGGDVRLEIAADFAGAIHWVDPADGVLLAAVAATPGEPHEVRVEQGLPMVLYLGPNRYQLDTWVTKPE